KSLKSQGYGCGLLPKSNLVAVKAPVFSFKKLTDVDIALNAEMKSTGEVLGIDNCYEKALIKAFLASGTPFVEKGKVLVSIRKKDLEENIPIIQKLQSLGFTVIAGECNRQFFEKSGINVELINKSNSEEIARQIKSGEIKMVFNLPEKDGNTNAPDFKLRKLSVTYKIPCFTCSDTIREYLKAWEYRLSNPELDYKTIEEYMK
ncbi:MAG: carbamoyl-phosphate synthase large subunit, partial [bacterium]|nr:carbamoyl-phosphate synthase large subunit [bacterium]